ncbi:MAG: CDP-alcohol phosphatidyltransferase family protein [Rhodospirillaceae bacterium]|nr:CDP-alcohol phosphatidyltransferase family protein [Rhodospirillaceae bacterium]
MLKHIKDLANLCTLLGLCLGLTGIYLSIIGYATLGLAALFLAVLCDIFDGIIARTTENRTSQSSAIGGQLDSLADLIHSGMGPTLVIGSWYGCLYGIYYRHVY